MRSCTAQPLRWAAQKMKMPIMMKSVAIALGTHAGSSFPNSALKPKPIPAAARPVRIHPAKVRSLAMMVRSSAQSVRSSAKSVRSSASSFELELSLIRKPTPFACRIFANRKCPHPRFHAIKDMQLTPHWLTKPANAGQQYPHRLHCSKAAGPASHCA